MNHGTQKLHGLGQYLEHVKIAVYNNTKLLTTVIELCFLVSFHIKQKNPKLNCGIKATEELI